MGRWGGGGGLAPTTIGLGLLALFLHAVRWPATLDKLIYPVDQSTRRLDAIGTVYTLLIGIFSSSLICPPYNTHEQIYISFSLKAHFFFPFRNVGYIKLKRVCGLYKFFRNIYAGILYIFLNPSPVGYRKWFF